jgi:hypothetical protein
MTLQYIPIIDLAPCFAGTPEGKQQVATVYAAFREAKADGHDRQLAGQHRTSPCASPWRRWV